jgi:hypothetical protein
MTTLVMQWLPRGEREWTLFTDRAAVDRLTVSGSDTSGWRFEARLGGREHDGLGAFATKEQAQGGALLLAMRHLKDQRTALQQQLEELTSAWWWKIVPTDDDPAEQRRATFSARVFPTSEAAERDGRASAAGCYLEVHGPRSSRRFGPFGRT